MLTILDSTVPFNIFFLIVAAVFVGAIALVFSFILTQSRTNKMLREDLKKEIGSTQQKAFSQAAEILASKLTEYTDKVLMEKVKAGYNDLISRELFPAVDAAAQNISRLSEEVIKRQEAGMAELANIMAEALAAKTKEYIEQESEIIATLKKNTGVFANEMDRVCASAKELSDQNNSIFSQTNAVSENIAKAAELVGNTVTQLSDVLTEIGQAMEQSNAGITANKEMINELVSTAAQVQQLTQASTELLASHNQKTAALLNDAVKTMHHNTEEAAKAVISNFSLNIAETSGKIETAVNSMKEIAESIQNSATQFSAGIVNSYSTLGTSLDGKLNSVAEEMTKAVDGEYNKIITSAENYANTFGANISRFNKSLDEHMDSLQSISQQLNNNISSFKNEARDSSRVFEVGIEKSVTAALSAMDESLAEIVKRLVSVTVNIQEAADALPKAVKAIKE